MKFPDLFQVKKPVIGMLHLNGRSGKLVFEQAKTEIEQMYSAGIDAVLVENYFGSVKDMERALDWLRERYSDRVYGVNVLGNDERGFRMAREFGAKFIQIDSICGHLKPALDKDYAEELAELRGDDVFLMGGVRFKYQPIRSGRSLEEDLLLGKQRCDGIVVTGSGTAMETDIEKIRQFRGILHDFPLIVGAGMTIDNCEAQLSVADAAIVGSWFKEGGITERPIDPDRVQRFMDRVRLLRQE